MVIYIPPINNSVACFEVFRTAPQYPVGEVLGAISDVLTRHIAIEMHGRRGSTETRKPCPKNIRLPCM